MYTMGNQLIETEEIESYLRLVSNNFKKEGFNMTEDKIDDFSVTIAQIENYTWEWLESQLSIFVILSASELVSKDNIQRFSKLSREYSLRHYQSSVNDEQTGVVSFALLTSFNIEEDAIEWVRTRPDKYFPTYEMPVLSDLKNNELYYYEQTPVWGPLYYRCLRDFIKSHF